MKYLECQKWKKIGGRKEAEKVLQVVSKNRNVPQPNGHTTTRLGRQKNKRSVPMGKLGAQMTNSCYSIGS